MNEILESDDYSEDGSYEENYAVGYGGYDDLYDDVIEEAGYDPWDIESIFIAEYNFDEEWPLFRFYNEIDHIDGHSSVTMKTGMEIMKMDYNERETFLSSISYAQVARLAMKFCEMCEAWRVRRDKKMMSNEEIKRTLDSLSPENKTLNLYQIELSERPLVRDFSVYRLVEVLGDESNVDIFFNEISICVNLLKSIMFMIIRNCLPPMISSISPVVDQVLEHLMPECYGLYYIGFVSLEKFRQLVEAKYLTSLYEELKALYFRLWDVMFFRDPDLAILTARRKNLRAHVYVLGKFLNEEVDLEDGGWTVNPDWEKDFIEINSIMEDLFKSYSYIFI